MEWMIKNNPIEESDEDAEECLSENWRYCFKYRATTIDTHSGDVPEIMNLWPALKNNYGFSLVSKIGENVTKVCGNIVPRWFIPFKF